MGAADVSPEDFHDLTQMVKQVRDCLMVSTPERGCVLDTIRKHEAQIATLEGAGRRGAMGIIIDSAVRATTTTITVLVITLIAKGFIVSVVSESIKMSGLGR